MLEFVRGALRSAIGAAEQVGRDVERHVPLAAEEQRMGEAVSALRRATESLERHVEVLDALGQSLPPLTESVTRLTDQLGELLAAAAPIAAAEREVSRLQGLFGRRRRSADD